MELPSESHLLLPVFSAFFVALAELQAVVRGL